MKIDRDLTEKAILPTLISLSWPIMVGEGMQLMYNIVDTFFVGQLGSEQLAAISLSFPLLFLLFSIAAGFMISGTTLVSQYTGDKSGDDADRAASQTLVFAVVLSVIFMLVGFLFGRELLALMNPEPVVLEYAWSYFSIVLFGAPMTFVYFMFSSVLRGIGDTKTPMVFKIFTVGINVVLDPLLIFGFWFFPELGIEGAAYATVIARLVSVIIGLFILFKGSRGIKVRPKYFVPDFKIFWKIMKIGVPASIGTSALSIAMTVMTFIVTSFGTYVLAAWGIVSRVASVIRLPSIGFSRATSVLVGQNIGAEKFEKAEKTAWKSVNVLFGIMVVVAFVGLVFAPYIIEPFADEPEVIRIGVEYLRIAVFAYTFLGIQMVIAGALKGAGRTGIQMFFRIFTLWILQIPLSYYLSHVGGWGPSGIWWGIFIAKLVGVTVMALWFRRGTWMRRVIE